MATVPWVVPIRLVAVQTDSDTLGGGDYMSGEPTGGADPMGCGGGDPTQGCCGGQKQGRGGRGIWDATAPDAA